MRAGLAAALFWVAGLGAGFETSHAGWLPDGAGGVRVAAADDGAVRGVNFVRVCFLPARAEWVGAEFE